MQLLAGGSDDGMVTGDLFGAEDLLPANTGTVKGEALSVLVLFAALPSGKSGGKTEGHYDTVVRVGNARVLLEVAATAGTRIATVADLRVLAAIITCVHSRIKEGIRDANPFVLDVTEVVEVMRRDEPGATLDVGGSYKGYVLGAIDRWTNTTFKITQASSAFTEFYRGQIELKSTFRLIDSVSVVSTVGPKGKTPERVAVHLNEALLKRIVDAKRYLLALSDEWMREGKPAAIRLGLYFRRAVPRSGNALRKPLRIAHEEIEPMRPYKYFAADMRSLYQERFDPSIGAAKIHDFLFQVTDKEMIAWLQRPMRVIEHDGHENRLLTEGDEGKTP